MSENAFERFVAGDDKLADLLRALPVFEAPASMALQFAERARAAQAIAAKPLPASLVFEPPASLETSFLAAAASVQAAQQPRHDAVINEIHAGKPAAQVLGHDVAAATAAWLASRPQRLAAQTVAPTPPRAATVWWSRMGVLMASICFGLVASNLWLARHDEKPSLATAQNDAPVAAEKGVPSLSDPVTLEVPPIAKATRASSRSADNLALSTPPAMDRELSRAAPAEPKERALSAEREVDAALKRQPAAPLQAEASAMPARPAAAPPPAMMKAAAAPRLPVSLQVSLSSAPQEAANRLQLELRADSRPNAVRIFAAQPNNEDVRAWVEQFRLALPAQRRPATINVEQDETLAEDVLRLQ